MIPTTNVIQRTFLIQDRMTGTGFTIDRGGRQYLATARHVAEGAGGSIKVFHEQGWKTLEVGVVGVGENEADIVVLAPNLQLSPSHPLVPTSKGLVFGQQVRLLGFPFGYQFGDGGVNNRFPIPFIKAGIVSMVDVKGQRSQIWVDAHGNKGFSGGPLVAVFDGNDAKAVGVVVNAVPNPRDLETIDEHAGFILAERIETVTRVIDSNPIGFELSRTGTSGAS